jgi:hypothetical protein
MNVAIYARVSTHDKDQNPETQLRPLRQHLAGLKGISVLGEFIDKAGADDLRGELTVLACLLVCQEFDWHRRATIPIASVHQRP